MTSVILSTLPAVAGRQLGAQRDGYDGCILGTVRHLDGDHVAAVVHRTVVEDVLDQARPGIISLLAAGTGQRAEPQKSGDAEQAQRISEHNTHLASTEVTNAI